MARPMPARAVHLAWRGTGLPPVELWTGRTDVVHGTNFTVPPARRAGRVVTVHDLTVLRYPEMVEQATRAYPALLRRAIGQGAYVHTPSEFVAHEVIELLGAPEDRVRTVAHGIPPVGSGAPAGALPAWHPGGPYILAIGTIEPRKDYPCLVAAFDRLASDRPGLNLMIVGGDGWGKEGFDAALARARHRDRVVRAGWLDTPERDRLLRAATVLAYPSRYEGFGLPPLEAMSAGVPVVATAAGALPEVLGDGAVLVPPGDADALAEALAGVIDDETQRRDLIRRGHARTKVFSWDRCAAGLEQLYRAAVEARS